MGPTSKKKKNKTKHLEAKQAERKRCRKFYIFFKIFSFQIFFLRFSSFCQSEFVGINTESALRDEGYA